MIRIHDLDGFQLLSGAVAMIAGLVMLLAGAPVVWPLLIIGDGALVLGALWFVNRRSHEEPPSHHAVPRAS